MASISVLPMLAAIPIFALFSFLAARVISVIRAARSLTKNSALPAPASATPAKAKTWARTSTAWVPTSLYAHVPSLSFPRVPWVRVASDAPEAPRAPRKDGMIELLPTTALPPPPMTPPPTAALVDVSDAPGPSKPHVYPQATTSQSIPVIAPAPRPATFIPAPKGGSHVLVDVSDVASPSVPHAYPPHVLNPAPRPASFIAAPKAFSSPNTRPTSPNIRLATTPPPPHRRSRSLGGVTVRRLSAGSGGSGLRNDMGLHEGILIDLSSSGEGENEDPEVSAGGSSTASDIGLAALPAPAPALHPAPSPSHLQSYVPGVALPLVSLSAPLVDLSDDKVGQPDHEVVDDSAWRWFGMSWSVAAPTPKAHDGSANLLPLQVVSDELVASYRKEGDLPAVPDGVEGQRHEETDATEELQSRLIDIADDLVDVEKAAVPETVVSSALTVDDHSVAPLFETTDSLASADHDPFADPVATAAPSDDMWHWTSAAELGVNDDETRPLEQLVDPFADPEPLGTVVHDLGVSSVDATGFEETGWGINMHSGVLDTLPEPAALVDSARPEMGVDLEDILSGEEYDKDGDVVALADEEQVWPDPPLMDLPTSVADSMVTMVHQAEEQKGEDLFPDPDLLPLPLPQQLDMPSPAAADVWAQKSIIAPAPVSPVRSPPPRAHALSQTPTPPASPPPIAHARVIKTLAFAMETEATEQKPVHAATPKLVIPAQADKENAPPMLTVPLSRSAASSRSPSPTTTPRPDWSRRADEAPPLGLVSNTGGNVRRVLGDMNSSVEMRAEPALEVKVAPKTLDEEVVPILPQAEEGEEISSSASDDVEASAVLTESPVLESKAEISPEMPVALPAVARMDSLPGAFPDDSAEPIASKEAERMNATSDAVAVSKPPLLKRASTWGLPSPAQLARSSPLDLALAMQLRPGLGAGADPAWMVRFLMAVYGWVVVSVAGGF